MSRLRVVPGIVLALSVVTCNHWGPLWVRPDVIYVVPRNFSGWICLDFDGTAPPLAREGKTFVVRPRGGEIVKTSDNVLVRSTLLAPTQRSAQYVFFS